MSLFLDLNSFANSFDPKNQLIDEKCRVKETNCLTHWLSRFHIYEALSNFNRSLGDWPIYALSKDTIKTLKQKLFMYVEVNAPRNDKVLPVLASIFTKLNAYKLQDGASQLKMIATSFDAKTQTLILDQTGVIVICPKNQPYTAKYVCDDPFKVMDMVFSYITPSNCAGIKQDQLKSKLGAYIDQMADEYGEDLVADLYARYKLIVEE